MQNKLLAGAVAAAFLTAPTLSFADDIVEIASGNESFSTLVAAVSAAGLVETLQGDGPFTVFAPTNAAFDALPAGTVETLLKPENIDQLTAILTYHVLPGEVTAAAVPTERTAVATVNGAEVSVLASDGTVTVDGATVITADIDAGNGVIHVIDSVILPGTFEAPMDAAMDGTMDAEPSLMNLAETAAAAGDFSTLLAALEAAGMASGVANYDSYTVFAPTDAAFAALPEGTVESLLEPANKQQLINVLAYHLVDGTVPASAIPAGTTAVDSLHPAYTLSVTAADGAVTVNGANVVAADVMATNGVIHVIDAVLLPSEENRKAH